MGQKKLLRFSQIKEFENVYEYPKNIAGTWHTVFSNENPIILELACGRGEYKGMSYNDVFSIMQSKYVSIDYINSNIEGSVNRV